MAETTSPERTTRKKGYAPTDADYHIESIRICEAENGVSIECSYALNDDAKSKMKKDRDAGIYLDGYYECDRETHVFQDKQEAKQFIIGELDSLWNGESGDERS